MAVARRATSVIRAADRAGCRCDRPSVIVPLDGAAGATHARQELLAMMRPSTLPTTDVDHGDRSMRVVEWVLALAAVVAAGVLAFVR